MGHHASKHKNKSSGTKTTSRLSSSTKPTKTTSISNSKPGSVSKPKQTSTSISSSQKFTKESRPLGSKDDEEISNGNQSNGVNNNTPMNAREALARAAEERYKKLQEQKMGQSDRLRAKAKQSKNDKGL